jgi:hypothetical protein
MDIVLNCLTDPHRSLSTDNLDPLYRIAKIGFRKHIVGPKPIRSHETLKILELFVMCQKKHPNTVIGYPDDQPRALFPET